MPERVKREVCHLPECARFGMLALKAGRFDVTALRRCGKNPRCADVLTHLQDRLRASGERNAASCVVRFSIGDFDYIILMVLPSETKALFGADAAIEQYYRYVAQQEGITRFDGRLGAFGSPYAYERTLIRF